MALADEVDFVVGVDTHMDTHTAAVCDCAGRVVAELQVPSAAAGYAGLLAWARAACGGGRLAWAVEGTGHYGLGLARYLTAEGEQVAEIDSAKHVGTVVDGTV